MQWIIQNKSNKLYWSNFTGWGSREGVTIFTDAERLCLHLPIEGEWRVIT